MIMKKFKRVLALMLALLMVLFSFAACSKNGDNDTDEGKDSSSGVPASFEDKLMEPYIKLILSGSYTYEAIQSGSKVPVTYAKDGDKKVLLTTEVDYDGQKVTLTIMKIDDQYYIVLPAEKAYTKASSKEIKEYNLDDLFSSLNLDNFANSSFVEDGTETIGDEEYQYEDYYSALVQITNRFYFDKNDNLKYVGNVDKSGKVKKKNSIKIYATNANTFDILSSYSLVDSSSAKADADSDLIG